MLTIPQVDAVHDIRPLCQHRCVSPDRVSAVLSRARVGLTPSLHQLLPLISTLSWHEHDADQIIESCDSCIEQACIELEGLGWTRQSVKVIGTHMVLHTINFNLSRHRHHQPAGNDCCLVSLHRQAPLTRYRMGRRAQQGSCDTL